ncbi:MAG: hypothetical protein KGN78_12975 [Actinomycetales bacterium]|nr:hypothetical protein [Actinomycetales bacterium]
MPQSDAQGEVEPVNLALQLPSSLTDPLGVTDWSAPGIGLPVEAIANPRLNEDSVEETDERLDLSALTTLVSLPRIDAAALERAGFQGSELRVHQGQVLGGSGFINGSVYNEGIASPGYSPGVQTVSGDWTQSAAGTVEFEFSGTSPGTGAGFHDQVNVSGRATLAGTIDLKLLDGFKPKAGDEFVVLTYGSVSGQFERGTGLFGLHDDVWFDIVQTGNTTTAGQVKLVARELGSGIGTGLRLAETVGLDTKKNQIGELLNADYFVTAQTVSFNGAFELGGLNVAGQFSLAATPGFARATLAANDLTVSLAGQQVTGDFSISVPLASSGATELAISDAALLMSTGSSATDMQLRVTSIAGAVLIETDGVSGVLRADDIDITDGTGAALSSLAFGNVKGVEVGFNTTGRSSKATIGQRGFDFSSEQHHDFFAVSADVGLTLSGGSVSYTLDGRFGIARQPMVLLEGTAAQQAFVVTLQEGKTALTVGSAPGGARVGLGRLEGALILGTLNGKFGAAGTLTIGEVSLTKADGTSALIPGLTILPVDLPFSFNLFELNPGQTAASSWGSFSFSLPSFPHFDFSAPSLPSFSLPNLKLSLPNLDLSKFSFPDLAGLLPSIGLDLPNWSLKLPNISLPSLSFGGGARAAVEVRCLALTGRT